MKTFNKVIAIAGLLGLSACAYNPVLGGYGRYNGYYGQNPSYGYMNGAQGQGYQGYGYPGYGNYGGYQQPQYGHGRYHHGDDD